jgi:hypothetical protein
MSSRIRLCQDNSGGLDEGPDAKVERTGESFTVTAIDEECSAARAFACFYVAPAIPDHEARRQINTQVVRRPM